MAQYNGRLTICDRCGAKGFARTIGDGETDGGYTRWNKFEPLAGWSYESDIGSMCPVCTAQWQETKATFTNCTIDRGGDFYVEF